MYTLSLIRIRNKEEIQLVVSTIAIDFVLSFFYDKFIYYKASAPKDYRCRRQERRILDLMRLPCPPPPAQVTHAYCSKYPHEYYLFLLFPL